MAELELEMIELDELPELSELEVDELLEQVATLNAHINTEKQRLDAFVEHYQTKIARAQENFDKATEHDRIELAAVTDRLERWARVNITGKKRSLNFPSGKLAFRRQQPLFTIGGESVSNVNPALIDIARRVDSELVKTREVADWAELKKRLNVDNEGNVYLKDTGELVDEMHAENQPDKFTLETA